MTSPSDKTEDITERLNAGAEAWNGTTYLGAIPLPRLLREASQTIRDLRALNESMNRHPDPQDLLRDLIRAIGWFDGARAETPASVWANAIAEVRTLRYRLAAAEAVVKALDTIRAVASGRYDHHSRAIADLARSALSTYHQTERNAASRQKAPNGDTASLSPNGDTPVRASSDEHPAGDGVNAHSGEHR